MFFESPRSGGVAALEHRLRALFPAGTMPAALLGGLGEFICPQRPLEWLLHGRFGQCRSRGKFGKKEHWLHGRPIRGKPG